MKAGRASRTAEMVCLGRALAHGVTEVSKFSDPTAEVLLPADGQKKLEALRRDGTGGPLLRMERFVRNRQQDTMVARTVEIDEAVRAAKNPQLVILGAGLDGRAFRMPELSETVIFEVDHPDSQRDKRDRASALTSQAREHRFVPVDFEKDDLGESLAKAGHDPSVPTTWIWEGVVMYLTPADVEATLRIIERRSAPKSRLVLHYHRPSLALKAVGFFVARLGEPFRSTYLPEQMRALIEGHGFRVARDESIAGIAGQLSPELGRRVRRIDHMRIVTADRR